MTIAYTELAGSPTETGSREEFSAVMELKCDWTNRFDVLRYFGNTNPPLLLYPHMPYMGATVSSLSCQPLGNRIQNVNGLASYDSAQITVNWSNQMDPETICIETIEPSGEFMTMDPTLFEWSDDRSLVEEGGGIFLTGLTYEIEYPKRQSVPRGYLPATGCVNAAAWSTLTLGLTFAAETLLYTPRRCTRVFGTDGFEAFSLAMSFNYRASGWNTFWRTKTGQWASMLLRSDHSPWKSYQPYNFNLLR